MKKKLKNLFTFGLILTVGMFTACSDDDDKDKDWKDRSRDAVKIEKQHDTAILLCSFGSTYAQPLDTYKKIVADYKAKFPNTDIYLSFTSRTIVSRVYAQLNIAFAQPDLWLPAIGNAGYKNVYVQSLHIIPGEEYLSLMNTDVKKNFMVPYPHVKVAKSPCLLEDEDDVEAVAKILYDYYKPRLDKGELVALMGHGNPDSEYTHANLRYDQLEDALQKLSGKKNILVATVDWGKKMFSHIREGVADFATAKGLKNEEVIISLSPIMSIAGDHAQNDMLGDLEDGQTMEMVDPNVADASDKDIFSWKLKLQKLGYTISKEGTITDEEAFNVIGLADHQAIRNIWINHMVDAIQDAESWNEHLEIED